MIFFFLGCKNGLYGSYSHRSHDDLSLLGRGFSKKYLEENYVSEYELDMGKGFDMEIKWGTNQILVKIKSNSNSIIFSNSENYNLLL